MITDLRYQPGALHICERLASLLLPVHLPEVCLSQPKHEWPELVIREEGAESSLSIVMCQVIKEI